MADVDITQELYNQANEFGDYEVRNPLKGFTGSFVSMEAKISDYGGTQCIYYFDGLEDIVCEAGYTFDLPIAQISVTRKVSKSGAINPKSAYGIWQKSAETVAGIKRWDDLKGAGKVRVENTPGHMMYNPDSRDNPEAPKELPKNAWEIIKVIGGETKTESNGADIESVALALLDGKTKGQFLLAATKDTGIKANEALRLSINNGTWLKRMLETEKVVVADDGTHLVVTE